MLGRAQRPILRWALVPVRVPEEVSLRLEHAVEEPVRAAVVEFLHDREDEQAFGVDLRDLHVAVGIARRIAVQQELAGDGARQSEEKGALGLLQIGEHYRNEAVSH